MAAPNRSRSLTSYSYQRAVVTPGSKVSYRMGDDWLNDVAKKFPWAVDKEPGYVNGAAIGVRFAIKV